MATARALHPHEAVLVPPAAQVALELRVHERRERGPLLTQRLIERLEVLFHDAVEHRALGTMGQVVGAGGRADTQGTDASGDLRNSHAPNCSTRPEPTNAEARSHAT